MNSPPNRYSLWHNNPLLVQGLGLCPALAVTDTLAKALGLALISLPVLLTCGFASLSLPRHWSATMRLAIIVLLAATLTSALRFLVEAFAYPLSQALGIFLPLIAVNAIAVFGAWNSEHHPSPGSRLQDTLGASLGFALVLILVGGCRELIGQGTLFAGMAMLAGGAQGQEGLQLLTGRTPALVAALPPGAFILMGLLMALRNHFSAPPPVSKAEKPLSANQVQARRVRVN